MSEEIKNDIENEDVETKTELEIETSSEAKKLRAMGISAESSIHSSGTAVKRSFSLKDFWFYYKWYILIVLFFVTVFSVLIVQSVTKEKFDVRILYAGPAVLTDTQRESIKEAFSQQVDADYNGDGKKSAELFDLILMNNDELLAMYEKGVSDYFLNPTVIKDNKETLSVNAMAGDYIIFMIDVEYYKTLHDNGVFIPLGELGITEGQKYDECAIYLNSLDIAKFYTALNVFPADTLICVRRISATSSNKTVKLWEDNKNYFKLITDFKLPEGFVPAA